MSAIETVEEEVALISLAYTEEIQIRAKYWYAKTVYRPTPHELFVSRIGTRVGIGWTPLFGA